MSNAVIFRVSIPWRCHLVLFRNPWYGCHVLDREQIVPSSARAAVSTQPTFSLLPIDRYDLQSHQWQLEAHETAGICPPVSPL